MGMDDQWWCTSPVYNGCSVTFIKLSEPVRCFKTCKVCLVVDDSVNCPTSDGTPEICSLLLVHFAVL